jgi:hypothetical protein
LELGVEESIVNEPLVLKTLNFKLQIKNTNNVKSEVRFKQMIRVLILVEELMTKLGKVF